MAESLIHDMLATAAEATGDDAAFLLIDAQARDIAIPVNALVTLHATGVYLTGRLRASALGLVDYLSDEAHGTGIINSITIDGDQTKGHNTEAIAIINTLEPYRNAFANGGAVIIGAGAMARSAAYALVRHFRVRNLAVIDRSLQQATLLTSAFEGVKSDTRIEALELFPHDIAQTLSEARLIINATPLGSFPAADETPIQSIDLFSERQVVLDMGFSPAVSRLLIDAAAAGAATISGLDILIRQVGAAYELLAGGTFPMDDIRALMVSNQA
jgi:shikimate dehydrogenase